jgi:phospholipid-binding lipoprotein MlaA
MRHPGLPLAALLLVTACAASPDPKSLSFDPLEEENREAHDFNLEIDTQAFGPVSRGYGAAVPRPVRRGISNLHENWLGPEQIVQYGLQGRPADAAKTTARFLINSTVGIAGIFDVAAKMGIPYDKTNFDEVFYRWGLPEGGYWEVPYGGPGTQRDWTGWAFDEMLDPTYYVLPAAALTGLLVAGGLNIVNNRYELDTTFDTLNYQSEDGYEAQRLAYIQNMRARLEGGTDVEELEDIYADQ